MGLAMNIKAIFFDMDGTLVHIPMSQEQFLRNIYQKLGLHITIEQIKAANKNMEKWLNEKFSDYTQRTREAFVESDYRRLKVLGVKGDLHRLSERIQDYWENFPEEANEKIYPEVKNVVRKLGGKGIRLAIVSHRTTTLSQKSLEKQGIKKYFTCIVSPELSGSKKGKLSPQMWKYALNGVSCKPSEVLHVDNEYETGIIGAKRVGIQPVLIDRKDVHSSVTDCIVTHDLTEILELLSH
uniref:Hydrolase containing protein n=1 Tax=uncultured marine crenarchaeote E37-7F TaxID=907717 RepID=G9BAR9_9ARCH|nr:hydrolase containing protein [uncultured marine crenarchaeote E37-7F]